MLAQNNRIEFLASFFFAFAALREPQAIDSVHDLFSYYPCSISVSSVAKISDPLLYLPFQTIGLPLHLLAIEHQRSDKQKNAPTGQQHDCLSYPSGVVHAHRQLNHTKSGQQKRRPNEDTLVRDLARAIEDRTDYRETAERCSHHKSEPGDQKSWHLEERRPNPNQSHTPEIKVGHTRLSEQHDHQDSAPPSDLRAAQLSRLRHSQPAHSFVCPRTRRASRRRSRCGCLFTITLMRSTNFWLPRIQPMRPPLATRASATTPL